MALNKWVWLGLFHPTYRSYILPQFITIVKEVLLPPWIWTWFSLGKCGSKYSSPIDPMGPSLPNLSFQDSNEVSAKPAWLQRLSSIEGSDVPTSLKKAWPGWIFFPRESFFSKKFLGNWGELELGSGFFFSEMFFFEDLEGCLFLAGH